MKVYEIPKLQEQLAALDTMLDRDIDLFDIQEIRNFTGFKRAKFFHLIKKPVTWRLDADVLDWIRHRHAIYQSAINSALREYIHTHC